ncbi:MAG: hypothetical protein GWP17_03625 [Aquificales bacterium]|nr:hypothetical protein [Aquificales bacterium]
MNKILIVLGLIFALVLTACGGGETAVGGGETAVGGGETAVGGGETAVGGSEASEPVAEVVASSASNSEETVEVASDSSGNDNVVAASSEAQVRLDESYNDALPVQSQLAIGILQLENSDSVVDESLAAELLPLWRAVQSLADSETAADAEVTAVLNQIQETMSAEQIAAIAAMQITDESYQAMLADGTISMRGAFGGNRDGSEGGTGGGGGRPGGLPGGGSGGSGLPGSDPSAQQTRIAERIAESGGDEASFQMMAMTGAVVRLLEGRTGEAPAGSFARGGIFGEAITAVSESTGLSVEDVQAALSEGKTLADIIQENGGDLEAIQANLIEVATELDFLQDEDPAEFVTNLLAGVTGNSGNE